MAYHPGWVAVVNDREVPTLRVLPGFVGIRLDPGNHKVQFTYQSDDDKKTLSWVSLATLGSLGIAWISSLAGFRLKGPA